jgi:hypothetical protein
LRQRSLERPHHPLPAGWDAGAHDRFRPGHRRRAARLRDQPLPGHAAARRPDHQLGEDLRPAQGRFLATGIRGRADTVFSKEFRYQPRAFTDVFLEALLAPSAARYARALGEGQPLPDSTSRAALAVRELRNAMDLPAFAPPISLARVEQDGAL